MTTAEAPDPRSRSRSGWVFAVIFLVALALRVAAVVEYGAEHPHADRPVIDEASYERWALEIAAGEWIGDEVFFQEPLYPYFIGTLYAVLGPERTALRLVQALLSALTCVGVGLLTRRIFGMGAGALASAALALHAPAVLFPCLLLKPNLALPVLVLLAWVLIVSTRGGHPRRAWWIAGLLAGVGALLRGNVLVLIPLLVLWPFLRGRDVPRREQLRRAALCVLGVACVLLPVAARNRAVGGVFALTTSGAGTNLYGGNNALNRFGVATEFPWVRGIPEYEADDWRREAERRSGSELDPGQVSRFWTRELLRSAVAAPGLHARILWNKLRLTLGAYEVSDNHHLAWDARYVSALALAVGGFGSTGTIALAGLLLLAGAAVRRRRPAGVSDPRGAFELALLALLYLGTIVLTVTSMRARLPLAALLVPFAGWCLMAGWRRVEGLRAGRPGPLLSWVGAVAVAAVVVHAPVLPAEQNARDLAERDHNLAVEILAEDPVAAGQIAERLVREHPRTSRFQILLAETELIRALDLPRDEAQPRIQAALQRLRPIAEQPAISARERFRARRLAGRIQLVLGNAESAERHLRAAREFDPDDPVLREMLATALELRAARAGPGTESRELRAEAARLRP